MAGHTAVPIETLDAAGNTRYTLITIFVVASAALHADLALQDAGAVADARAILVLRAACGGVAGGDAGQLAGGVHQASGAGRTSAIEDMIGGYTLASQAHIVEGEVVGAQQTGVNGPAAATAPYAVHTHYPTFEGASWAGRTGIVE